MAANYSGRSAKPVLGIPAGIARALNERQVPSPSAYDPYRNRNRSDTDRTLRTVAEILANPRYTGRQVWNRQRTDHHETIPGDKQTSLGPSRVWNPRSEWVISERPAHPALVSEADFLAVQQVTAIPAPKDQRGPPASVDRAGDLRGVWPEDGCALGPRPPWISVPARLQQCPVELVPAEERVLGRTTDHRSAVVSAELCRRAHPDGFLHAVVTADLAAGIGVKRNGPDRRWASWLWPGRRCSRS
jgi:hypothetical protein